MRTALIATTALALAGCMTTKAEPPAPPAAACDAARAGTFIGQPGVDVAEAARTAAGARSVRVIKPGDAVTMDYREDRLNLELDADGRIAKARCG